MSVNLLKGEQRSEEYLAVNPLGGVPALQDGDFIAGQSLAIINYLEKKVPNPSLWLDNSQNQALAEQVAFSIAEDIHPLINLKTQKYLAEHLGADEAAKKAWYAHWTMGGMQAVERILERHGRAGDFALGDKVSIADICLVPNMYSMRRFGMDLSSFPLCLRIERHCVQLPAFQKAAPEMQPDAPDGLEQIHGPNAPFLKDAA